MKICPHHNICYKKPSSQKPENTDLYSVSEYCYHAEPHEKNETCERKCRVYANGIFSGNEYKACEEYIDQILTDEDFEL